MEERLWVENQVVLQHTLARTVDTTSKEMLGTPKGQSENEELHNYRMVRDRKRTKQENNAVPDAKKGERTCRNKHVKGCVIHRQHYRIERALPQHIGDSKQTSALSKVTLMTLTLLCTK